MGTVKNEHYTQIPHSLMSNEDLTDQDKLTLGVILSFIKNDKECYIGNDKLGAMLGITKNAASTRVLRLQKLGCISLRYVYRDGTNQIEKRYITLLSLTPKVSSNRQEVSSTKRRVSSDRQRGIVPQTTGYLPTDDEVSSKLGGIIQDDNTSVLNNLKDKVLDKVLNKQNSFEKEQILSLLKQKFEDGLASIIQRVVEGGSITSKERTTLNENSSIIFKKLPILEKYLEQVL